jgi:DNA integrity scanning protein DisA with diadenylate cyclase activity
MNTKKALLILLRHTKLLSEEVKDAIEKAVPDMDKDRVIKIGTLLALAEQEARSGIEREIQTIDSLRSL